MRTLLIIILIASALGCNQEIPSPENGRTAEAQVQLNGLEFGAASLLGLVPPVEFADLIDYPTRCSCSGPKGILLDAEGTAASFKVRSGLCPPGTTGLQWKCELGCDDLGRDFAEEPEKNRAVGVLLAIWLIREFSDSQISALPKPDPSRQSPFTCSERGQFVLSLSEYDPAMEDLPKIVLLSGS